MHLIIKGAGYVKVTRKNIFSVCTDTAQILEMTGSQKKIGFDSYQLAGESNPGRLGEKHEHYLYAIPCTSVTCFTSWTVVV